MSRYVWAAVFAAFVILHSTSSQAVTILPTAAGSGFVRDTVHPRGEADIVGPPSFAFDVGASVDFFEQIGILNFDISQLTHVDSAFLRITGAFGNRVTVMGRVGNGLLELEDFSPEGYLQTLTLNLTTSLFDVTTFLNTLLAQDADWIEFRFSRNDAPPVRISGLLGLEVTETAAVPLPPALALFASGLGLMGLLSWRRKKQGA